MVQQTGPNDSVFVRVFWVHAFSFVSGPAAVKQKCTLCCASSICWRMRCWTTMVGENLYHHIDTWCRLQRETVRETWSGQLHLRSSRYLFLLELAQVAVRTSVSLLGWP